MKVLSVGALFGSSLLPFLSNVRDTGKNTEEEEYLHVMKRITVLLCYISLGTYSSTRRRSQQPCYPGLFQHLWQ